MRQHIKELVTTLAKEQFGDVLKKVIFSGPFEEEDLDADLILSGCFADLPQELWATCVGCVGTKSHPYQSVGLRVKFPGQGYGLERKPQKLHKKDVVGIG